MTIITEPDHKKAGPDTGPALNCFNVIKLSSTYSGKRNQFLGHSSY